MPSYNPTTGKRLSGAAQRKRKQALASSPESGSFFSRLGAPPLSQGVEACVTWANDVGLVCIATASHGSPGELLRIRVVSTTLAKLGMLKEKALRSEQAVNLRNQMESRKYHLLSTSPPLGDAMAAVGWAYFQLVRLLYTQCQQEITEENLSRWEVLSTSVARLGYVKEQVQTAQLTRRLLVGKTNNHCVELQHVSALRPSPAARIH